MAPRVRAEQTGARVDTRLKDRLSKDSDTTIEQVIVTSRPGKKSGLLQAIQAQGGTVRANFTSIEAFAADLPAGLRL